MSKVDGSALTGVSETALLTLLVRATGDWSVTVHGPTTAMILAEHVPDTLPEAGEAVGLGFRVPLFIVSPWARAGTVYKPVCDHTSILQFVERTFSTRRGLTPVGLKPPISFHSEWSTRCSEVSRRTPQSWSPRASATSDSPLGPIPPSWLPCWSYTGLVLSRMRAISAALISLTSMPLDFRLLTLVTACSRLTRGGVAVSLASSPGRALACCGSRALAPVVA